jgi:hypothetical protein
VNDYGVFETTLAHPGTYSVLDSEIQVSEAAIRERRRRSLFDGDGIATWTFDEGAGDTAYDRVGGYHATLHGDVKWTDGEDGSALRFGESAYMETRLPPTETFTFSVWMRPERFGNRRVVVSSRNGAVLVTPAEGVLEFRLPGVDDDYWSFGAIEAGRWAHVAISYDGTRRMGYVDGEHRGSDRVSSVQPNWGDWLRFGGKNDRHEGFVGAFDTVQIYDRALGLEEVQALSERSS